MLIRELPIGLGVMFVSMFTPGGDFLGKAALVLDASIQTLR
jgi:hypothetical protein